MKSLFTRKPGLQHQQFARAKALTTTAQASPSFANRLQQKFNELKAAGRNLWIWFTGRASQAPAIIKSQAIALRPLAEPLSTSVQAPSVPTSSPIPTLQHIDQTELKQSKDIAQEIKPVLKAIELSKENMPEKKETALMVCTPPGIEIDFISALESFDAIINFIKILKIQILTEAGLNREEVNDLLEQLKNDQKYIYQNAYTTPKKPELHEIIIKLRHAGINPLCVNIINIPKENRKLSIRKLENILVLR